jgi:hypothetical protein
MDLYRNGTFTFSNEWLHSKNSQETSDGVNGPRVLNVVGTSLPCQLEVGLTVSSCVVMIDPYFSHPQTNSYFSTWLVWHITTMKQNSKHPHGIKPTWFGNRRDCMKSNYRTHFSCT